MTVHETEPSNRDVDRRPPTLLVKLLVAAVVIIAVLVGLIVVQFDRNKGLRAELTSSSDQVERQKELINALQDERDQAADSHETVPIVTSDTIHSALSGISDLVTQEYVYRNADKKESSETWIFGWERPFSTKSILILYDGVIKAGVDFSAIDVKVDENSKTVTVTIPKSRITDNNIPQETIEVVEVKDGLFNDIDFDYYNEFVSEQKTVMEQKAIDQGILERADSEARRLVKAVLSVLPGMEAYKLTVK